VKTREQLAVEAAERLRASPVETPMDRQTAARPVPMPRGRPRDGDYPDHTTKEGAEELARRLQQYWHDSGHPQVRFWVVPGTAYVLRGAARFDVRSNLVGGLPPRGGKSRA